MAIRPAILLLFTLCSFTDRQEAIPGISLVDCRILSSGKITTEIAGLKKQAERYEIVSKTRVQTACNYGGDATFEMKENRYELFAVTDSSCQYLDSIYKTIEIYWKEKEEWANKYNTVNVSSDLFARTGFIKNKTIIIPYISSEHENEGAYAIIWFNKRVYKIVLTHSEGFGGLSSFLRQNFRLNDSKKTIIPDGLVKKVDETKLLLTNKSSCF